jgi:hypothetical protein
VLERQVRLGDLEPGAHRIGGHRRLAAEAGGEGEDLFARLLRQAPLAREWLLRGITRCDPDQPPRCLLRDPEPTTLLVREGRDRDVAVPAEQRAEIAAEIGVAEQEVARGRFALPEGQRLPLPAVRQPNDAGAGILGRAGSSVARAVVGDDHLRLRELSPQLRDRRPDPRLLVARRDQDREGSGRRGHDLVSLASERQARLGRRERPCR